MNVSNSNIKLRFQDYLPRASANSHSARALSSTAMFALVLSSGIGALSLPEDIGATRLASTASAATNVFPDRSARSGDRELTAAFVNVYEQMTSRQVELDSTAKSILYSRLRELYRR